MNAKDWKSLYAERTTTARQALSKIRSGHRVFIGSGCGQPRRLVEALRTLRRPIEDIELIQGLTLGVVGSSGAPFADIFRHNAFCVGECVGPALAECRADYTPVFSSEIPSLFSSGKMPVDVALVQVRPPDENGLCNLGVSVGITLPALKNARYVVAETNAHVPLTFGATMVSVDEIDAFVPSDEPITEVQTPPADAVSREIAHHCVRLIEDGATLRMGFNAVSTAVAEELVEVGRRDLGVHTETFTEPIMDLMKAGVVTNTRKQLYPYKSVACRCQGTRRLYDFVHGNPQVELHTTAEVCDPFRISRQERMVAIIRADQVDLTGQVSDGRLHREFTGGFAGRSDFMHGAAASRRGKPIVVLPSTTADGSRSTITMFLDRGAAMITTGPEAHYVVTEWGVAALHGRTIRERAVALIAVAHPRFREDLLEQAKQHRFVYDDQMLPFPDESVYPEHVECEVRLESELSVFIRPARPSDERIVQDFIYRLGDRSIYYRFHGQVVRMSHSLVQQFVNVNYSDTMTVLAFLADDSESPRLVGMGQYLRYPDSNKAEVAFITHDDFQNRGVGTEILATLARYARKQGLEGFFAEVLHGNHAMLRVFQKSGITQNLTYEDGVYTVKMDL